MGNTPTTDIITKVKTEIRNFSFYDYEFYVLTLNDIHKIKTSFDGHRILYRNKGYSPLTWIIKPKDIPIKNIYDMKSGIVYFNSSSPYLSQSILTNRNAYHSVIDEDLEKMLYMKHYYSKYFVLFACNNFLIQDVTQNILRLYIFVLINK